MIRAILILTDYVLMVILLGVYSVVVLVQDICRALVGRIETLLKFNIIFYMGNAFTRTKWVEGVTGRDSTIKGKQ